ncbi:MAG TPA: histone deacetylase family protein [Candidatus Cybelea sp.]|nr:histone deacetylase family protein [Candidatus Cybelea sp.]
MKCVFDEAQNAHAPARYLRYGNIVAFPESPARVQRLLQGAAKAGLETVRPRAFDRAPLGAVHTARYLDFLEHGHAQWRAVDGAYPEMMPSIRPLETPSSYPESILGRAGWHIQDFSSAVTADTWGSVHASAMTALTAADLVLGGERAAYALCRPPGHHAYQERAGGFCYLNNAAITAQSLRQSHPRVAVLDIDVHHGNGTQAIFYDRADVLTISIHGDPAHYYPFFYGYADQRGAQEGEGFNLNLPVPVKSKDEVWQKALGAALQRIADFAPGALVLALGLDAHEADPLAGGGVTTAGFGQMAGMIAGLNLPTVLIQEGGYLTPYLSDNLAAFLTGFQAKA